MPAGYITLTLRACREDDQYVARCEQLGISTCAKSLEAALERVVDATALYLRALEEEGERARTFRELGIEIHPGEPPTGAVTVALQVRPGQDTVRVHNAKIPAFAREAAQV